MAVLSQKSTFTLVLLLMLCGGLAVSTSFDSLSVSSVEVVNHTRFTPDETKDLYVILTVGVIGQGFNNDIKIRPTSRVALRGSECYKNHPMKSIDSNIHIFKQVTSYLLLYDLFLYFMLQNSIINFKVHIII